MFDGHNVFFDEHATYGKSWGMADYMEQSETPMIVVGVECNHNPNNGRLSEYSPFTVAEPTLGEGRIIGRGRTTMEWLTLFRGSYGRTDLPTGNEAEIFASVRRLLSELPDKVQVFPGHMGATTIGFEKKHNLLVR